MIENLVSINVDGVRERKKKGVIELMSFVKEKCRDGFN